ncbi:hypothetical protein BDY17DRAFT_101645 [Neohortaea acidophila]|uniref:Uncharacterized protein n=1 Tax=Neohortaea acidophila TaxID=245834 RepID=A0A6A6Q1Q2_9PEZI|nr:uncharacterized protein BDY17DRAFT_101645 [Neohortaea acidophila]KAF2485367.1 hypothetical protein BDY17DRAFT_101645 [Neohortaea acidophila]
MSIAVATAKDTLQASINLREQACNLTMRGPCLHPPYHTDQIVHAPFHVHIKPPPRPTLTALHSLKESHGVALTGEDAGSLCSKRDNEAGDADRNRGMMQRDRR